MNWFQIVPEQIARNPIARAVMIANLRSAVRDFQTRMYLLEHGEDAAGDIEAAASVIAFGMRLHEQAGRRETPEFNVMRGALSALGQMRGRWSVLATSAIDVALMHALSVAERSTATEVQRAWKFVREL